MCVVLCFIKPEDVEDSDWGWGFRLPGNTHQNTPRRLHFQSGSQKLSSSSFESGNDGEKIENESARNYSGKRE